MRNSLKSLALMAALMTPALATADDTTLMTASVTEGALRLTHGFAFATLPNQPVAGGFMTIANEGDTDDRLLGARADVAGVTQIHTMAMDDGVMVMRELPDGLELPVGETVTLEPGGYHIMFMQLNAPLVEGETVPLTLTFEQAGDVDVILPIIRKTAGGMGHGAMGAH